MVTVESRSYSGVENSVSEERRPHVVPFPSTKRILEIKVNRWRWLLSMGYSNQAGAALADIREFAEQHSPYTRRIRSANHPQVSNLRGK